MTYIVTFSNREPLFLADDKAEAILLRKRQGMLTARQTNVFKHVTDFKRVRRINEHRIHVTKDIFEGDCLECQKAAAEHRKTYWGDDA